MITFEEWESELSKFTAPKDAKSVHDLIEIFSTKVGRQVSDEWVRKKLREAQNKGILRSVRAPTISIDSVKRYTNVYWLEKPTKKK